MKLIIDVDNKTLQVEEGVSIGFLLLYLENNLKDWKEYKLVSNTNSVEQITPLTFPSTPIYPQWNSPSITYTNDLNPNRVWGPPGDNGHDRKIIVNAMSQPKRPQHIVKSSPDEL